MWFQLTGSTGLQQGDGIILEKLEGRKTAGEMEEGGNQAGGHYYEDK